MGAPSYEIADLRARLARQDAPALWRSFEAVADTPAFRNFLAAEFPAAAKLADGPDRRQFLRLMAASFAMAGLTACDAADSRSKEVPYVRNPERIEPGQALSYASSAVLDGIANGILVTTFNGRPLKIEGNPQHPWSRGGTDAFGQASILDLYNPARSQTVRYLNRISTWAAFRGAMTGQFAAIKAKSGEGFRLLTGPITSPSILAQIDAMRVDFPQMHWHRHDVMAREPLYAGTMQAFGERLETRWAFDKARAVVSIDGDFLDAGPQQVALSRAFTEARRTAAARGDLLELHAAASTPNLTSAKADRHIALDTADLTALVGALGSEVDTPAGLSGDPRSVWLARTGAALRKARGASIVLAGATSSPAIHEAVHRLNAALGNIGQTVTFTQSLMPEAGNLPDLVAAMRAGAVSALVILDADPVYASAGGLGFTDALAQVPLKIHAGQFVDATAAHADWHVPVAHPLESWGDARSLDGTVSLMQPTIAPLYGGRSAAEILSLLSETQPRDGHALLEDHWRGQQDAAAFAPRWRQALIDGFMPDSAFPAETVTLLPHGAASPPATVPSGFDVLFRPDPTVRDGRHADNPWLQELPKPLTKITWENPVAISPALAEREGLAQGDMVVISAGGRSLTGPVWILPGQSPNSITLYFGYGNQTLESIVSGLGYDAYTLQSDAASWHLPGATIVKTGHRIRFATTQDHSTMEGHDFVRVRAVASSEPPSRDAALQPSVLPPQGVAPKNDDGRAWGMVIDEDACIGCNACVVACQSENNIPVVGREQVAVGREMHWLRIDRYYSGLKGGGGLDDPDTHFQPVPCMHCENAPCEVGCPVEATLHDHEGLNLMVYNRCIGTRACSGYCPYKVRHFNYLDYTDPAPSLAAQRNPEVTVRAKGVMEKCTYCVHRVAKARIDADLTNSPIADGSVQTACQSACPTRAITFGDLNQPGSAVATARQDARNYALLGELNLRPRTTYLAERGLPAEAAALGGKG